MLVSDKQFRIAYRKSVGMDPRSAQEDQYDPFTEALTKQIYYDNDRLDRDALLERLKIEKACIDRTIEILRRS